MGKYEEIEYFGVKWRVFVVNSLEEGIAAIQRGEEAVRFDWEKVKIGPDGAKKVAAELKNNRTLKILVLWRNNIGPEGAGSLAEALKVNSTLTTLDLYKNEIGPEGAGSLAEVLKVNNTLTTLHLFGNIIGPEGAGLLAEALKVNSTLTELDLGGNLISNQGAGSLAEALKVNSSLTTLHLWNNEIGDQGAGSLAEALKVNSTLTTLDLRYNRIGDEGAGSLAEALKVNSTLTYLGLSRNSIGDDGGNAFATVLEELHGQGLLALQKIGIDGVSNEIKQRIERCVQVVKEKANAFNEDCIVALQEDKEVPWGRAKLMIVGKGAAGKSSTVRSLLGEEPVSEHLSTIGCDLHLTTAEEWRKLRPEEDRPFAEMLAKQNALSKRESWDLRRMSFKAVASITRRLSSKRRSTARELPSISEVREQVVEEKDVARQFDVKFAKKYQEKGSKASREVSFTIWDYGGQDVFYALHHLFLTQYGMYLVVFDMREALSNEKECLKTLRFWLDSIVLHAPDAPFVLVGTFLDKVQSKEEHKKINRLLEKGLDLKQYKTLQKNKQDKLRFFPLNNACLDPARATGLRQVIEEVAGTQDYVKAMVKLRWMAVLEDLTRDRSRSFFGLDSVYAMAQTRGVPVDQVRLMLEFFHELGVVVHLTKTTQLAQYVITQPQWLLDGLTLLIRDKQVHANEEWKEKVIYHDLFPNDLEDDLDDWLEKGLATKDLATFLMKYEPEKGWREKDVDYLFEMMQSMQLASVWETEGHRDVFVVPSLLPRAPVSWLSSDCARFHQDNCSMCWIQFDFLPTGLFARFLSSMVRHFGNRNYKTRVENMYLDHALVVFNEECSFLVSVDDAKNRVIARFDSECEENVPTIVRLLSDEFAVLSKTFMHDKLKTEIILSSNGTDSEDACVAYALFKKAHQDGKKKCESLKKGTFVKLEVLSIFQSTIGMTLESSSEAQEFDVFLSHNWGDDAHGRDNHKRVEEIAKKLRDRGLRVFFDAWHVKGNLDVAMSTGIDRSRVFVVFVTQKYMDKVNSDDNADHCWAEFEYAVTRKKKPLPVVMEKGIGNQSNWCGKFLFRTGKQTYVDLSGDDAIQRESNVQWLYDTIKNHTSYFRDAAQ